MTTNNTEFQGTILQIESATAGVYTTIGEIQSFDGPGGSAKVIDVTSVSDTRKSKRMGLPDEGQFQLGFNNFWNDAGQALMYAARNSRTRKNFKITFMDGHIASFAGYVLMFQVSGQVDDVIKGKATIEIDGAVTIT